MASLLRIFPWLLTFIIAAILVWQTGMTLNNALTIGVIVMAVAVPVSRFAARLFKQSRERLSTQYLADTPVLREEKMPVLPILVGVALVLLFVVLWSQVGSGFLDEGRTLFERGLRELQPLDQRQAADAKTASEELAQSAQLAYGPQDGQLQHDDDERLN